MRTSPERPAARKNSSAWRMAAASAALSLTDSEGELSNFRLGESRPPRLQWWRRGRCCAKTIKTLVWTSNQPPSEDQVESELDVLTTSSGKPRITVVPSAELSLAAAHEALRELAGAGGTAITTEKALEQAKRAKTKAAALARERSGQQQRRRRERIEITLSTLTAPLFLGGAPSASSAGSKGGEERVFRDVASIRAPLPNMEADDTLPRLRSSRHSVCASGQGSAMGADGQPFGGIQWAEVPSALHTLLDSACDDSGGGDGGGEGGGGTGGLQQQDIDAISIIKKKKHRRLPDPESAERQARAAVEREERKRQQCDAFAALIAALDLPDGTVVVDFGCGSCGLTLPLAWAFPQLQFIGVDLKMKSLQLMDARAAAARLDNVRTVCRSIAGFKEPFGLAIALHACGQASDEAILQAVKNDAPYLVAPCCIGKLRFSFVNKKRQGSGGDSGGGSGRRNPEGIKCLLSTY